MTHRCSLQVTSYEPIVELRIHVEFSASGFALTSRHRHYGGLFMDCELLTCQQMTLEDLAGVVDCLLYELGPMSLPANERLL